MDQTTPIVTYATENYDLNPIDEQGNTSNIKKLLKTPELKRKMQKTINNRVVQVNRELFGNNIDNVDQTKSN